MIVVKVGGSLFDHPNLSVGLCAYLADIPDEVLLVAGGGTVVDAVRALDRTYHLGEEACHWLAARATAIPAAVLARLAGVTPADRVGVLDAEAFLRADEGKPGCLPHTWAVTTDSIAARVARVYGAAKLVLLKSVEVPAGTSWQAAATAGWVDAHFPTAVEGLACPVKVLPFRAVLDRT